MRDINCFHRFIVLQFMGSKEVTSAMLAAIFVSDVTMSTAHLYEI